MTNQRSPKSRTFFEDVRNGQLLFFLSQESGESTSYLFSSSAGQKVLAQYAFDRFLKPVNPSDPNYRFSSVRDSLFFEDLEQSSAKSTEHHLVTQSRLESGELATTFAGGIVETHAKGKLPNPYKKY